MADVSNLRANINGVFETFGVKDKIARENTENLSNALSAAQIVNSASGAFASFPDGADDIPVRSLSVDLEPIQDLHGYDHPWPAGGGKNKYDGVSSKTLTSGGFVAGGGTLAASYRINLPAAEYKIIFDFTASTRTECRFFKADGTYFTSGGKDVISGQNVVTLNCTEDVVGIGIYINAAGTASNIMICLSSVTDYSYAPYENICPIIGRDAVTVTRTGKNLISFKERLLAWGSIYSEIDNNTFVITATGSGFRSPYQFSETDIDVTLSGTITNLGGGFWRIDLLNSTNAVVGKLTDRTTHVSAKASKIRLNYTTPGSGGQMANIQLELGSAFTGYEPYTGGTYTNNLPSAFFGGTVDFVSGLVSSEWAEISSYSGETLPGEWLSSYDKYAEGATPTTGAQVVYKLETPQTDHLTSQNIKILKGTNNVWSDGDTVTVDYVADPKLYIDKKIAEVLSP